MVEVCRHQPTPEAGRFHTCAGLTWFVGDLSQTMYGHVLPPNPSAPDCFSPGSPLAGIFFARSRHPGGVHAAMADGSVRFVSGSTSVAVWRAMGTRAGGEVIESP